MAQPGEASLRAADETVASSDAPQSPRLSVVAGAIAILMGCVVLIGWALNIETLKRVLPGLVAMNPATALCFIAAGGSLIASARAVSASSLIARGLAAVPTLAGAAKLLSLMIGLDIPLDRWLFASRLDDAATGFANRMAPNTALNFLLVGSALLLLGRRSARGAVPAQSFALAAALASLLAVFGYAYGTKSFYGVGSYIPMALHTALTFLVLISGVLAFEPRRGMMATFSDAGAGGVMARRLMPVVIGLPFVSGWFRLQGERAGLYDTALGVALTGLASTVVFVVLVWWTASLLRRADERRLRAEAERNVAAAALAVAHEEVQRKNEHMEADLLLAREIQQAFLPQQFISFPRPGVPVADALRFYHRYQPTTALGGDFADVLLISDKQAGIFICDVMGHGVRSALVTAVVRGLAEELMTIATDPGQFLTQMNKGLLTILQRTKTPMFMTAFYLVADVEKREMRYASAGHPAPLRRRTEATGESCVETMGFGDAAPGPALGVFLAVSYETCRSSLEAGDLVLLFTDGLVEIENEAGEEFDENRLLGAVRCRATQSTEQLLDEILAEAIRFSPRGEFEDDVCLMGMEVTEPKKS